VRIRQRVESVGFFEEYHPWPEIYAYADELVSGPLSVCYGVSEPVPYDTAL
jgi:hypothetical protein